MTAELVPQPVSSLTPTQPLGSARSWSRDLAIVGGLSSLMATGGALLLNVQVVTLGYVLLATLAGTFTGALMGPLNRRLLTRKLGTVKIYKLLALGLLAGGVWGGATGALAGLYFYPFRRLGSLAFFASVIVAGAAGALQYFWFWLPYTVRRAKKRSTWPILLSAAVLAPAMGLFGVFAFFSLLGL